MRDAVADQVMEFRDRAFAETDQLVCRLTGVPISKYHSHVDHISPNTFAAIAEDWLKVNKLSFAEVELARSHDGYGWTLSAPEQIAGWSYFHRAHAQLRLLSPQGNLSEARI